MNVTGGNIASGCIAVSVSTDSLHGYTASISGPTSGNLTTSNNLTIGSTTGTMAAPTTFASQTTGGAWGFAIPSGQIHGFTSAFDSTYTVQHSATNTSRFAQVPATITPFSQTTQANTSPNVYHVFFAVAAGPTLTSGVYSGQVTFSANINATPPPLILMQDITHQNCPANRTMVTDARDNRTYWIQRMPDGLCWMQTNLAYAGGGNNTFGDVMDITEGITGTNIDVGQVCRGDDASLNAHGQGCFWEPTGSNPTAFPDTPSISTDGTGQFGYLYNWCAAMGSQPAACQTATAEQPNQSISVCPAGWRLPTGGSGGEFEALNNVINGGATNTSAGLLSSGLFQYGGWFFSGSFGNAGTPFGQGVYWASSAHSWVGGSANTLNFWSNIVGSVGFNGVSSGFAVRCVAKEPLIMQEITAANCPLERTLAIDARDNRTYWIRRIPNTRQGGGDLCWMETNLAYAGGGNNQFGDVMNIGTTPGTLTAGTSAPGVLIPGITGLGQVCRGDNVSMNTHVRPCFWEPLGSNITTFPVVPSTSTAGNTQYGLLYSWCAAMGGQSAACQTTAATPADPSINICPAGWRLPTGNPTTGEFALLNNMINAGSNTSAAGLLVNGLFQWSGSSGSGGFNGQGINGTGNFLTSTVNSTTLSNLLFFNPDVVNPGTGGGKSVGFAVRCVRE